MTTDCSLNYEFSTWKLQVQNMLCTQIVFCFGIQNRHVLSMFWACNFHLLNLQLNEQSFVIWVNWCKNKCFWKRFTCKRPLRQKLYEVKILFDIILVLLLLMSYCVWAIYIQKQTYTGCLVDFETNWSLIYILLKYQKEKKNLVIFTIRVFPNQYWDILY